MEMNELLTVTKAEYVKDYILRIRFSNGVEKLFDFSGELTKGICKKDKIGSINNKHPASKATDNNPIPTKDIKNAFFILSIFLAPYNMEKRTPLPIQRPKMIEFKNVIRVKEEPTAANAFEPINCPTIKVSATLYNCCNMFPKIIGNANNNNDFVTDPLIKFSFIIKIILISAFFLKRPKIKELLS